VIRTHSSRSDCVTRGGPPGAIVAPGTAAAQAALAKRQVELYPRSSITAALDVAPSTGARVRWSKIRVDRRRAARKAGAPTSRNYPAQQVSPHCGRMEFEHPMRSAIGRASLVSLAKSVVVSAACAGGLTGALYGQLVPTEGARVRFSTHVASGGDTLQCATARHLSFPR
jgi:hypothetical protein